MSAAFYSQPSYMHGGGLYTIYSGSRRQRGGSFFGSMRKYVAPIGRTAIQGFKTAARTTARGVRAAGRLTAKGIKAAAKNKVVQNVAQKALEQGVMLGTNVAVDALQGRNVGDSLKRHSTQQALDVLTGSSTTTPTAAESSPRRRRGRKRTMTSRKLKQNGTTRAVNFTTAEAPPAKRRRRRTLSRADRYRNQLF